MTDKQKYISFCQNNDDIPLFLQTKWLSNICEDNWDVFLIEQNNTIIAAMPFFIHKKYGFTSVCPPLLTPYCGIYINHSNHSLSRDIYNLDEYCYHIFATKLQSKNLSYVIYPLLHTNTYPLSFFNQGFTLKSYFTYMLKIDNCQSCFANFDNSLKTQINKAEKTLKIITQNYDLHQLYNIIQTTFFKQNIPVPYSFELFSKIVQHAVKNNYGKMFVAIDNQNNINSLLFIVWDKNTCYDLIPANNPNFLKNNCGALLKYAAIKFASSIGITNYDFEGSYLQGVEKYLRRFSPIRHHYIVLEKYNSAIFKFLKTFKNKKL